eukprot:TsM_001130000 transcript=TsM_001130000 gene=TsM_001130000
MQPGHRVFFTKGQRRHTLGFKCQTTEAAEALWKWAVDRQCFFTLNKSTDAKASKASGRFFRKRQFYSFTGRCQKEMLQITTSMPNIPQPSVSRWVCVQISVEEVP